MSDPPAGPFRVVYSGQLREELQRLRERAVKKRIVVSYLLDVRTMQEQLTRQPLEWGELRYELRHLGLKVCHKVCGMLYVVYAVDEARRLVYPTTIVPMSNHPLGEGD